VLYALICYRKASRLHYQHYAGTVSSTPISPRPCLQRVTARPERIGASELAN